MSGILRDWRGRGAQEDVDKFNSRTAGRMSDSLARLTVNGITKLWDGEARARCESLWKVASKTLFLACCPDHARLRHIT